MISPVFLKTLVDGFFLNFPTHFIHEHVLKPVMVFFCFLVFSVITNYNSFLILSSFCQKDEINSGKPEAPGFPSSLDLIFIICHAKKTVVTPLDVDNRLQ